MTHTLRPNQFRLDLNSTPQVARGGRTPRVAVVGAGIAGLTAAWELRRIYGPEANILLVDAYDRLGGKLKTVNFGNGPVDVGAEAYLGFREDFTELVRALGLGHALRSPSSLPGSIYAAGELADIPKNTLMGIPADGEGVAHIIGVEAAQQVDAERNGQPMTWEPGQDTTVGQLVGARLGRAVVDKVVSPLLGGVYSCSADDLGVRATMPELAAALDSRGADGQGFYLLDVVAEIMERKAKQRASQGAAADTAPRTPVFQTIDTGYATLVNALAEQAAPEILLNTPVESIGRHKGGWYIEPIGVVDAVIVATPAPTAAVLLQHVATTAADVLHDVELASSVVVGMRMDSAHGLPERSGILLGTDAPTEAKAFTFSSRKWPHIAARGGAVVRASFGSFTQPWHLEVEDRALLSFALDDLEKVTGERKNPQEYFVQRWWGGLPCYGVGYMERMNAAYQEIEEIPGLGLAGAMLNGVGVPATAASGMAAARSIAESLS
ncbi:MAG TPA: protoporphyrinogen oxidase [Candidatus Corynebacterium gallistercoris]|uniref:Coproporphyrinogen III oxidase n=1 Tax=Candidatus Corynebacterium gallistercoris TaxID=2838530 RepID=A0A9D1RZY8_9CORY|nr:protoporphyrinogen oxidase [Candidatus Corynebacterium gallistercoris]